MLRSALRPSVLALVLAGSAAPASAQAEGIPLGVKSDALDVVMTADGAAHVARFTYAGLRPTLVVCRIPASSTTCTQTGAAQLPRDDGTGPFILASGNRVTAVAGSADGANEATYAMTAAAGTSYGALRRSPRSPRRTSSSPQRATPSRTARNPTPRAGARTTRPSPRRRCRAARWPPAPAILWGSVTSACAPTAGRASSSPAAVRASRPATRRSGHSSRGSTCPRPTPENGGNEAASGTDGCGWATRSAAPTCCSGAGTAPRSDRRSARTAGGAAA